MALQHEMDNRTQGSLSLESKGIPFGELIRDYEPAPDARWRFGKPNYARVNKLYFQHRSKVHAEGSLEAVVSKVVKNWEVESHHLADPRQWKTMDTPKFRAAVNGGPTANAQLLADVGPYNFLLGNIPQYSAAALTLEESNSIFSGVFTEGFAFEVLEVLSGPPSVTFKWRHFGKFAGSYTDSKGGKYQGQGQMLNLHGLCIAKVNDQLVIEELDVYYNPDDLMKPLTTATMGEGERPITGPADELDRKPAQSCGCGRGQPECALM